MSARLETLGRMADIDSQLSMPLIGKQLVMHMAEMVGAQPITVADKMAVFAASAGSMAVALDAIAADETVTVVIDVEQVVTSAALLRAAADLLDLVAGRAKE